MRWQRLSLVLGSLTVLFGPTVAWADIAPPQRFREEPSDHARPRPPRPKRDGDAERPARPRGPWEHPDRPRPNSSITPEGSAAPPGSAAPLPRRYPAESRERLEARRGRLEAHLKAQGADRAARKVIAEKEIKKRWGKVGDSPLAHSELQNHAWRVARLKAIRQIAADEGRPDAVARADALLAKEAARHEQQMRTLPKPGAAQ